MDYRGIIIEESLASKEVLNGVTITKTKVEQVTEGHKTPWLSQWTLHTVEIPEDTADAFAETLSRTLETRSSWYADFKNETFHFIVYRDKVFKVDLTDLKQYRAAKRYGISLGIPEYQVDFAPEDTIWKR